MLSAMTNTQTTIDDVSKAYQAYSNAYTQENFLAWDLAYSSYLQEASSEEDLEQLLQYSSVYRGLAVGSVHPSKFEECQNRLSAILKDQISGCTTIEQIRQVADKLRRVDSSAIHLSPGQTETRDAIKLAYRKWYDLCETKDDLVQMMKETRNKVNVYDFVLAGTFAGLID